MTPEQFYNSKGKIKIKFDRRRHTLLDNGPPPFIQAFTEGLFSQARPFEPCWNMSLGVSRKGPYVYCGTSDHLDRIWMNVNTKAIVKQTPDMYITRFLDD